MAYLQGVDVVYSKVTCLEDLWLLSCVPDKHGAEIAACHLAGISMISQIVPQCPRHRPVTGVGVKSNLAELNANSTLELGPPFVWCRWEVAESLPGTFTGRRGKLLLRKVLELGIGCICRGQGGKSPPEATAKTLPAVSAAIARDVRCLAGDNDTRQSYNTRHSLGVSCMKLSTASLSGRKESTPRTRPRSCLLPSMLKRSRDFSVSQPLEMNSRARASAVPDRGRGRRGGG